MGIDGVWMIAGHLAGLPEFLLGVARDDMKGGVFGAVSAFNYEYMPQRK